MTTLEVHDQLVTWADDFAETMMKFYSANGVPFKVHENSVDSGLNSVEII